MKKIFTLLAAAAITVSASAFDLQLPDNLEYHKLQPIKQEVKAASGNIDFTFETNATVQRRALGARKADGTNTIEGEWTFSFADMYMDISLGKIVEAPYMATLDDMGQVIFIDETGEYLPFIAQYSPSGLLTFNKTLLGYMEEMKIFLYQEPYIYNKGLDYQTITGHFYAEEGIITFNPDTGIAWNAYEDQSGTVDKGLFIAYDFIEAQTGIEKWSEFGTGTFLENIAYPFMSGGIQNSRSVPVNVMQSDSRPNVFKVLDPFQALYSALGIKGVESPYMILDATDPNNVLIPQQSVGFMAAYNNQTIGVLQYVGGSFVQEQSGGTFMPEEDLVYATYKVDANGNHTIGIPKNTCFLFGFLTQQYYRGSYYGSVLEFKANENAVENIVDENDNAPVEYFNIQGIRVSNPEAGQLVIKRQGNKVEKIIY